jgi:hypothetical protein
MKLFLKKLYSIGNVGYILKSYSDLFYIGNWGNWNLIAKNIFQFIELSIVNIILSLNKKSINFDFISIKISNKYIKKKRIGKFDL